MNVAIGLASGEGKNAFIPTKDEWKSIGASTLGGAVAGAVSGGLSSIKDVKLAVDTIRAVKIGVQATAGAAGAATTRVVDNLAQGRDIGDGVIEHTLIGGTVSGFAGGSSPMKGRTEVVNNILTGTTEDITRDSTTAISTAGREVVTGGVDNFMKSSADKTRPERTSSTNEENGD